MPKTKTSSAVKNRYNSKAYDRILFVIPKGQKATIEAAAAASSESVNMFIQKAVLDRLGLHEWPKKEMESAANATNYGLSQTEHD